MCDIGADAGVDVAAQSVRSEPQGLSEDDPVPEVAANGGAAGISTSSE